MYLICDLKGAIVTNVKIKSNGVIFHIFTISKDRVNAKRICEDAKVKKACSNPNIIDLSKVKFLSDSISNLYKPDHKHILEFHFETTYH